MRFGGLGHGSHQNGLDADVYYPRIDGLERRAYRPSPGRRAARPGPRSTASWPPAPTKVYVGPSLHLQGPRKVVVPLVHHDDHMHVRLQLKPAPSPG